TWAVLCWTATPGWRLSWHATFIFFSYFSSRVLDFGRSTCDNDLFNNRTVALAFQRHSQMFHMNRSPAMKNRLCVLGILGLGFLMTLGGWVNGSALPSNVNLKSMWGGNPNQQCFKSCDCGYGCRYNPNISKCEICVAPIGSTTEYICCVGGTEYCD